MRHGSKNLKVDLDAAKRLIEQVFHEAEEAALLENAPTVEPEIIEAANTLFSTHVQAYREALLGCALVRVLNESIDIRLPYLEQGEDAFSGRTLDEKVVNPFLVEHEFPCSRGPFLAVFRRKVKFDRTTRDGLRDKTGYDAFLKYLDALRDADKTKARSLLLYLAYRFIQLRDESRIEVRTLPRVSLDQIDALITRLLEFRTGGRWPVLIVVALLQAVSETYNLGWRVDYQGINVADQPSGVAGDITVWHGSCKRLVLEVTERTVDDTRMKATFRAKISSLGIRDYLFMFATDPPTEEARGLASSLFAQGYDVGFVAIRDWVYYNLATAGHAGREAFVRKVVDGLKDEPASLKSQWNEVITGLIQ